MSEKNNKSRCGDPNVWEAARQKFPELFKSDLPDRGTEVAGFEHELLFSANVLDTATDIVKAHQTVLAEKIKLEEENAEKRAKLLEAHEKAPTEELVQVLPHAEAVLAATEVTIDAHYAQVAQYYD